MDVAGARLELHMLHDLAGLDVVFDQARRVTLIVAGARLLITGDLPDEPIVVGDAVQPFRDALRVRGRDHVIHFPGLGIDPHDRLSTVDIYPDFADVLLPGHAVRGAAVILRPEGDLSMADLLAVHVGLEYSIDRRCGMRDLRCAVGAAPDVAAAKAHAAAVLAVRHHGMQELAVHVDEPGGLGFVVVPLLLYPEAAFLVVVDVDRVGPAGRREKQLGGLRLPFWDCPTATAAAHAAAKRVRSRLARCHLRRLCEGRATAQTRAQADARGEQFSSSDAIRHWRSPLVTGCLSGRPSQYTRSGRIATPLKKGGCTCSHSCVKPISKHALPGPRCHESCLSAADSLCGRCHARQAVPRKIDRGCRSRGRDIRSPSNGRSIRSAASVRRSVHRARISGRGNPCDSGKPGSPKASCSSRDRGRMGRNAGGAGAQAGCC